MKKIGYADASVDLKAMLQRQIEIEDRVVFSKQPMAVIERNYTHKKFELTETAKHVFTRGIALFKL